MGAGVKDVGNGGIDVNGDNAGEDNGVPDKVVTGSEPKIGTTGVTDAAGRRAATCAFAPTADDNNNTISTASN